LSLKVLFVTSELAPLAKAGGLGDVAGALPGSLRDLGLDVRVIMPLYKQIKDRYTEQLRFVRWAMIRMGWRTMYSGLFTMTFNGVPIYFIDNEFYFGHGQLYLDYSFDVERYSFFQRAVLESIGTPMDFEPDILHLNDWQSGMIPVLLDAHYKPYGYHSHVHTVFTIHNLKYQGIHGRERIADLLDIEDRYMTEYGICKDGVPNFMKAGVGYSDRVTTVSPTYAGEIMTDYFGEGLHWLMMSQSYKLSGILNGIDDKVYNPATDPKIAANFTPDNWQEGKAACKKALQEELGLAVEPRTPLASMITRLVDQKGLDLLIRVIDEMLEGGMQLAILGTGDAYYENTLKEMAARNPDQLAVRIMFNQAMSHRFYAGADMFLMPSLFEPCGLSQMISLRYGTVPVVRATGGLKDTVFQFDPETGTGNGFLFPNINAHEFLFITKAACKMYVEDPETWNKLVVNGMSGDYSWKKSAQAYSDLYTDILKEAAIREAEAAERAIREAEAAKLRAAEAEKAREAEALEAAAKAAAKAADPARPG
jgi:starch synthase